MNLNYPCTPLKVQFPILGECHAMKPRWDEAEMDLTIDPKLAMVAVDSWLWGLGFRVQDLGFRVSGLGLGFIGFGA